MPDLKHRDRIILLNKIAKELQYAQLIHKMKTEEPEKFARIRVMAENGVYIAILNARRELKELKGE